MTIREAELIEMKDFSEAFGKTYDMLYEHDELHALQEGAANAFDEMARNPNSAFRKFLLRFCKYRNDIVSSDREAAAFMIVYSTL